jgi:Protein of unknown function (DUF2838)
MISEQLQTRLNHTLYLVIIVLTAYIWGAFPDKFYLLHSLKTISYLFLRFVSFKQRKFHYYMCDFCYIVNLFSMWVSFVSPQNLTMQKILFVTANGPLALAVIVFKNKVVLHSMDQNTSTFIHISAMLLSYIYRWHYLIDYQNESWLSLSLLGIGFYFAWAAVYGILMFVVLRDRIVDKGNMTMYDWAIEKTGLAKLKKFTDNEKVLQFVYMCIHGFFTCLSFFISPLFWYNQLLHFGYILLIITMAFWNGSSYYANQIHRKDNTESIKDNKEKTE